MKCTKRGQLFFIIILLVSLLPLCSQNSGPPCTESEVRAFFINPSEQALAAMSRRPACSTLFNSTLRLPLDSIPGRDRRLRLVDSAGAIYGLGIRTPAALRSDTLYPLIIYLHGGTGSMRTDKGDSAYFMLEALSDTFDLFLASPSANRAAPWWSPAGLSRILQTLRYMTLHFPVDPDKIFLAGVSDGATGCYAAANTINAPFAGFFAVSGFGGMLPGLGMQLVPANLMQRPIYNVNAGKDHIYPIDMVKQFVADLKLQGVGIIEKIYPDEKHGFDYRAGEMGALAGFIRSWSRPHATAVAWTFIPGFPNLPGQIVDWRLSQGAAFIRAFWSNDTLVVRSQGLSSFTIPVAAPQPKASIVCRFPDEQNKTRKIAPQKTTWPLSLRAMVNRCYPAVKPMRFYTVVP